jgi:hypothetical protein
MTSRQGPIVGYGTRTRRIGVAIVMLIPPQAAFVLATALAAALDFRANLDTAVSPDLSSYRYVHFAAPYYWAAFHLQGDWR